MSFGNFRFFAPPTFKKREYQPEPSHKEPAAEPPPPGAGTYPSSSEHYYEDRSETFESFIHRCYCVIASRGSIKVSEPANLHAQLQKTAGQHTRDFRLSPAQVDTYTGRTYQVNGVDYDIAINRSYYDYYKPFDGPSVIRRQFGAYLDDIPTPGFLATQVTNKFYNHVVDRHVNNHTAEFASKGKFFIWKYKSNVPQFRVTSLNAQLPGRVLK